MQPVNVLVLGATGMLGSHCVRRLSAHGHRLAATQRRQRSTAMPYLEIAGSDVRQQLTAIVSEFEPNYIINTAGVLRSEVDKTASRLDTVRVNSEFPHILADVAFSSGARVFHVSSNAVFGSTSAGAVEGDTCTADDFYGTTKRDGEPNSRSVLNIRASFIGRSAARKGLVGWVEAQGDGARPARP